MLYGKEKKIATFRIAFSTIFKRDFNLLMYR